MHTVIKEFTHSLILGICESLKYRKSVKYMLRFETAKPDFRSSFLCVIVIITRLSGLGCGWILSLYHLRTHLWQRCEVTCAPLPHVKRMSMGRCSLCSWNSHTTKQCEWGIMTITDHVQTKQEQCTIIRTDIVHVHTWFHFCLQVSL